MEQSIQTSKPLAVEMLGITKYFGSLVANKDIFLDVRVGEIHCLVGEIGAGKTTLMNILYGLLQPDEGEIRIFSKPVKIQDPMHAMRLGIGMVHQHFRLVNSYTVAENVVLGREPRQSIFFDKNKAIQEIGDLARQFGMSVDPQARVQDLPVGVRQRVEILKTLYRGSQIIILDEPTAVLTPQESRDLFVTINQLVDGGKTVIFITHKLKEVMAVANRVTVLRKGERVGVLDREQVNEQKLTMMMVGREVMFALEKGKSSPSENALDIENLSVRGDHGNLAVKNVSFNCRRGEIVTIAGVEGNGQTELIEAITGLRKVEGGEFLVNGQKCLNSTPAHIRAAGLSHIPPDRIATGLCIKETTGENLIAGRHSRAPYCNWLFLNLKEIRSFSESAIQTFNITTSGSADLVGNLSGGNMQKVVLAREVSFNSKLLVAVSPTRGIDVASIESIHKMLIQARDQNRAVLVVSTDLEEVFQISDRILVMYNGEIVGEFKPENTTREELGVFMLGARRSKIIPLVDVKEESPHD
jgi:ABC-type uncharacterized transport system ATPase subunit